MNTDLFNSENIIDGGVELFGFDEDELENPQDQEDPENPEDIEDNHNQPQAEEPFTEEDLFDDEDDEDEEDEDEDDDDEEPESVGGKEGKNKNKAKREGAQPTGSGSSPKGFNPYSSFAQALYGDGLFQSLDDEKLKAIVDADTFSDAWNEEINSRLDAETRRIKQAMDAGLPVNVIKSYETTLKQLKDVTDSALVEESERGKNLRTAIIRQDYLNRGFSKERAEKEVKRIIGSETELDDARDALDSVKEFYETKYEELTEKGRQEAEQERKKARQQAAEFKKAVLETEKIFGDVQVDKATRRKAYELMTKVVKTTEDNEEITAVQQYADEHPVEFRTILGIVAAMTDTFTKPGNLFKKTVNKKVRSNLQEIERRFSGNPRRGGTISFAEGEDDENDNRPRRGFRLDI